MPQITCTKALKEWEAREGNAPLAEAKMVRICGGVATEDGGKIKRSFITKLDNGLNGLKECEYVVVLLGRVAPLVLVCFKAVMLNCSVPCCVDVFPRGFFQATVAVHKSN